MDSKRKLDVKGDFTSFFQPKFFRSDSDFIMKRKTKINPVKFQCENLLVKLENPVF